MKFKFLHTPTFHYSGAGTEKKASWLELFYDLMYVASFIQLGNIFSKDVSLLSFIKTSLIFLTFWVSWSGFSFFSNRYTIDDFIHRFIVFAHMFSVASLTVLAPQVFKGEYSVFSVVFGTSQLIVALLYLRVCIQNKFGSRYSTFWFGAFSLSGAIWLAVPIFSSEFAPYIWGISVMVIVVTPLLQKSRNLIKEYPFDYEHLSERYSLLTIIVLGESFVKVLTELLEQNSGASLIIQACFALLLACSIWWIYFDDVADTCLRRSVFALPIWLLAHIPLQMGIIFMGVGIKKVVAANLALPLPSNFAYLLSFSMGTILTFVGVIDLVAKKGVSDKTSNIRVILRIASGLACLFIGVFAQSLSSFYFVLLLLSVVVLQIFINIIFVSLLPSSRVESSS